MKDRPADPRDRLTWEDMFDRKKLDRERLEIFLVHWLLACRLPLLICGSFLLIYAIAVILRAPLAGSIVGVVATYLLLLATFYRVVLLTARLAAWLGTLGRT
jgi:hypothetical protein